MTIAASSRYILASCMLVALLAGCGGSPLVTGAPGVVQPERRSTTSSAILYVGTENYTAMLSYPSLNPVGQITGPNGDSLGGICPDEPTNSVYAVDISSAQAVVAA